MSSVNSVESGGAADERAAEIAYVRAAGILGKPGRLMRLFDFLAGRASTSVSPKESEIALEVFLRQGDYIAVEDAVVRVYVHRLRKRLDALYEKEGSSRERYLQIPRGEYRLVLTTRKAGLPATDVANEKFARSGAGLFLPDRKRAAVLLTLALFLIVNIAGWRVAGASGPSAHAAAFLDTSPWVGLSNSDRPLLVVLGDYYIHGELDEGGNVRRLVREFSVNSRDELYQSILAGGGGDGTLMDLGLSYLPTSSAAALASMAPLISARPNIQVVTASALTLDMIKDNDILYIGFISGLGQLQESVFRGSRIELGDSYDELKDRKSDIRYVSEGSKPSSSRQMILDYGYFSTMPGPHGNRITILAGTRDVGLAAVAAAMVDADILDATPRLDADGALEMLFEAEGAGGLVLTPNLLLTEHHDGTRLWTTGPSVPMAMRQ